MTTPEPSTDRENRPRWLDDPKHQRSIFRLLLLVCALLVLGDLLFEKHAHFEYEYWFGFNAAYGFVAYVLIVTTAKGVRRLLGRREDYYDD